MAKQAQNPNTTPPIVTIEKGSENYPERLNKLGENAPAALQVQGNTDLLKSSTLSFAGGTTPFKAITEFTDSCVKQAVQKDITIVTTATQGTNRDAYNSSQSHDIYKDGTGNTGKLILIISKEEHKEFQKQDDRVGFVQWDKTAVVITQPNEHMTQKEQQSNLQVGLSQAVIFTQETQKGNGFETAQTALDTDTPVHAIVASPLNDRMQTPFSANADLHKIGAETLGFSPKTQQPNMEPVLKNISMQNVIEKAHANGLDRADPNNLTKNGLEIDKMPESNQQETTKTPQPEMER